MKPCFTLVNLGSRITERHENDYKISGVDQESYLALFLEGKVEVEWTGLISNSLEYYFWKDCRTCTCFYEAEHAKAAIILQHHFLPRIQMTNNNMPTLYHTCTHFFITKLFG